MAINVLLAMVGGALLLLTVRTVGWDAVQQSITGLGWWFLPVLLLGGLRFSARSRAWMVCAGPDLPFRRAFSATLAGDALGNVTPLGLLASEPAKVFFVRDRVPTIQAVSSVAAENAFYVASVLIVLALGAVAFFARASVPPALRVAAQAVLLAVMVGGVVGVWIARQRPAILSRVALLAASLTGRKSSSADRLREIEIHFYALLTWPAARVAQVFAWEALFHILAVAEVFLVMRLLPGSATLADAFVLETTGRLIVVAFKFVPYRLGVDEAGTALVARALALDPAIGVTLALVRRVRILCWNGVGLLLLLASRK